MYGLSMQGLSSVSDGPMSESGGDWEVPANYLARGIETNQKSCSKRSCFSMYTLHAIVKVCKILSWRSPSRFVAIVLEGDPSSKIVGKLRVLFIGLVLLLDLTWSKIAPFDS